MLRYFPSRVGYLRIFTHNHLISGKNKEVTLYVYLNDIKTAHKLKPMKDAFPTWDQLDILLYVVVQTIE